MEPGILESNSLWYKYKVPVWEESTPEAATVHNIMRTLRSVRNIGPFAYVSVPITSGKFYYERKLQRFYQNPKELMRECITHNYHTGWKLVESLKRQATYPILYPADLVPARQKWTDAHFQALWLSIIGEMVTEVHMTEGWNFSNGGCEEFVHALQLKLGIPEHKTIAFWNTQEGEERGRARMRKIMIYDHRGDPLTLEQGRFEITSARDWIVSRGFAADRLDNCLRLLDWTGNMISTGFYQ